MVLRTAEKLNYFLQSETEVRMEERYCDTDSSLLFFISKFKDISFIRARKRCMILNEDRITCNTSLLTIAYFRIFVCRFWLDYG